MIRILLRLCHQVTTPSPSVIAQFLFNSSLHILLGPKLTIKSSAKNPRAKDCQLTTVFISIFFLYSIISVVKFVKIFFFLNIVPSGVALAFFCRGWLCRNFIPACLPHPPPSHVTQQQQQQCELI